jgi:hypothetical protein
MLAGQAGQALARVERLRIQVGLLEVRDFGAASRSGAVLGARGQERAVPAVVVVDAGAARIPSCHLADQPGKRVGRERRLGIGELDAAVYELGKCR